MNDKEKEWWQTLFDEKYLTTYVDTVTPERTAMEVDFILDKLELEPRAKILDLACGHGRHSLELAKRGFQVTGIDYSEHFIKIAKEDAERAGVNVTYLQDDMRNIAYKDEFDAVLNIFTSFGYFKTDADNVLVLQKIKEALNMGGKFLININNVVRTTKRIMEHGKYDAESQTFSATSEEELSNGLKIKMLEHWNPSTKRWQMKRTWKEKGEPKGYETDVRMFDIQELLFFIEGNGLRVMNTWGDFEGGQYDPLNSKSIILLARKDTEFEDWHISS